MLPAAQLEVQELKLQTERPNVTAFTCRAYGRRLIILTGKAVREVISSSSPAWAVLQIQIMVAVCRHIMWNQVMQPPMM